MIMCAVAIPLIAAGVGAAASIYSAKQAADDASAARAQTEQQTEQARKTAEQQIDQAQQAAAQAPQASETRADVTAAVQANRKRVAAAYGMGNTITGAGDYYSSGLGVGQKKRLGM